MSDFELIHWSFELPTVPGNIFTNLKLEFDLFIPKDLSVYDAETGDRTLNRKERLPFEALVYGELAELKQTLEDDNVRPLIALDNKIQTLSVAIEKYLAKRNIEVGILVVEGDIISKKNQEANKRHKDIIIERVVQEIMTEYD